MLSEDKYLDIAHHAVEFALKKGCSHSRCAVGYLLNNSVECRNGTIDRLAQSCENGLTAEVFVDGRYGSFSTNRLDVAEVEPFIKNAIEATRFLAPDPCRQLPSPERYYRGAMDRLDMADPAYHSIAGDTGKELAQSIAAEIAGSHPQLAMVSAEYSDSYMCDLLVDSQGFEGVKHSTCFSVSADVSLLTGSDARSEDNWYDNAVYFCDLEKEGIARKALERAERKIGREKIASGRYRAVVDATVSSRLLKPLLQAMFASGLQQHNSFLLNRLHTAIASPALTLYSRPHLPRTHGARLFDSEGVATAPACLIEKGVLNTCFINTYYAAKMQLEPTLNGPATVQTESGSKNLEQLLRSMDRGIWLTGFNGGNCNSATGDFSYGIEGFWVENGKPVKPLGEMNLTGNMLQLWQSLLEAGNDAMQKTMLHIPSLLFSELSFSGQ
jgi:PmbA protein